MLQFKETRHAISMEEMTDLSTGNGSVAKDTLPSVEVEGFKTPDGNRILLAVVLKILFVAVLALGTKRFVVGITISAFALLLLEYVGKCVYKILEPCSNKQKIFHFLTHKVVGLVQINKEKVETENLIVSEFSGLIEGHSLYAPTSEILAVQTKSNLVSVNETEVMERKDCKLKTRHSRRARMKLKMKKLVPKNLRSSKKRSADIISEVDVSLEEDICKEQEQFYQCESSGGNSDSSLDAQEVGRETKGNSGYWVALCLIVLVGLVGGRIFALVLTICWCLLLKSGGIRGRYMKVPMVRPFVKICNQNLHCSCL